MLGRTSNEISKYLVVEKVSMEAKAEERLKARQAEILAKAKERVAWLIQPHNVVTATHSELRATNPQR